MSSDPAEELGPLFVHPQAASEPIFWLLPAGLALAALILCAIGLIRGRLPGVWLTAGLVTLPAVAFALASLVLMERSKKTEFCGSCHLMGPIEASVLEENSSLASVHVHKWGALPADGACYTCHSGYGIWGDVGAKYSGIWHMVHTVTGRYELPLKMWKPFNINACLACHAESTRFRAVAAHRVPDIQKALVAREMGCTGVCHPAAHPAEALSGEHLQ